MLIVYRYLTTLLFPIFLVLIFFRLVFKKEDSLRYKEKIFSSSFNIDRDPSKKLIWFHVASIGELLSILPLIDELNKSSKNINILITSVTLSSSKLFEEKLNQYTNVIHRFFPLDTEHLSRYFLNSWKPDLVCFVDSEIWPNYLFKIKEKKIPLILINARITKKTFDRWKIFSSFAKKIFNNFDLCLASSEESKNNLEKLQVKNINYIGNLKFSFKNKLENLSKDNKKILDSFKVWCAASTHAGEEVVILKAHKEIKKEYNNILTIIVPRHINRVSYIKNLSNKYNLNAQILNDNDTVDANTEILIINSFGVLSKYFNYCENIFIGKSFVKKLKLIGGQNPIEAAKAGCRIFHGPYIYNFKEIYTLLNSYGISEQVNNVDELSHKLLISFKKQANVNKELIGTLDAYGEKILKQTTEVLKKFVE
jgi:3-deoxy-D-manno-octulosonic-acid transferase|tara:strand:- start:1271 stop:2542 length:1272 start_codon:yes stop_codon:yes gene_type:complete